MRRWWTSASRNWGTGGRSESHGHRRQHPSRRRGRHGADMSPEQAAGKRLDRRSDVFSFGVMLGELVAGHRPFEGPTDLHVLGLIQHGEPAALGDTVPRRLRALIAKALAKDPDRRYQSMNDLAADLKRIRQTTPRDTVVPVAATSPRRRRGASVGIVAASSSRRRRGVASLATGLLLDESARWRRGAAADGLSGDEIDAAISPDGNFTAFLSDRDGRSMPGSPQRAAADSST